MTDKPFSVSKPAIIKDFAQLDQEGTSYGLRARDVRAKLLGCNVDPKVAQVMESLAEELWHMRKENTSMAEAISEMASIIGDFTVIAENMKNTIQSMHQLPGEKS